MNWSLEGLEHQFPRVPWRLPASICSGAEEAEERFACRVCVANHGITPAEIGELPTDAQVIEHHIRDVHQSASVDARRVLTGKLTPPPGPPAWLSPTPAGSRPRKASS